MFNFDPGQYRSDLEKNGFAHLKGVLTPEFVSHMKRFLAEALSEAEKESQDWKIEGKKRQFVFEFPSDKDADRFRRGMSRLTGIAIDDFTISERHLKVYDDRANPYPAPHKDRSASQYSIGLPVDLADRSTVCVFPDLEPGHNEEDHAVFLEDEDQGGIDALYASKQAIMLNEQIGDVVIFLGSTLFHERVRAAGTAVLYFKVNAAGIDPLGENIYAREDLSEAVAVAAE